MTRARDHRPVPRNFYALRALAARRRAAFALPSQPASEPRQ